MEDFLELLVTILIEITNGIKLKKPRVRTFVITGIFTVLSVIFVSLLLSDAASLYAQGNTVGTIVMSVIALAIGIVSLIVIIRGHRSSWVKY